MKYLPYTFRSFKGSVFYDKLPEEEKDTFNVLGKMFQFKANNFVLEHLIDWDSVPNDPIYKLIFPRRQMLHEMDFKMLHRLEVAGANEKSLVPFYKRVKAYMQPRTLSSAPSFPTLEGKRLPGMYSNFPTLLSLYPSLMSKTCHAYCSYCVRWTLFGNKQAQDSFSYDDPNIPVAWLREHPEVKDVLFTGADPMVLPAEKLKMYIDPLLGVESVKVIRISTKSLGWWPYRFTTDRDADEVLKLFEYVISRGKHMTLTAHFTHPRELEHPEVKRAIKRIRATGTGIRCQGPLIKEVNDNAKDWSEMWSRQIELGMIPYYMFIEANHHPTKCFRVPLAESLRIFRAAQKQTTSLARTVRGPVFVHDLNRILLSGTVEVDGNKYFVLKSLQSPRGTGSEGDIKLFPFDKANTEPGDLFDLFNDDGRIKNPST